MGADLENVNTILSVGVKYREGVLVKCDIKHLYEHTRLKIQRKSLSQPFLDTILKVYHLLPGLPYLPDALYEKT
eukprot:3768798-Amphidinium_carterae.1